MGEAIDLSPDAVVIRFRPTDPDAVMRQAEKEFRRSETWRLSSFAAVPEPGETESQTIDRLRAAAGLGGIDLSKNKKTYVCARAADLIEEGFTFWTDDQDTDETPKEHVNVDLGNSPSLDDVERFVGLFKEDDR